MTTNKIYTIYIKERNKSNLSILEPSNKTNFSLLIINT